jgi:hypothetical protein
MAREASCGYDLIGREGSALMIIVRIRMNVLPEKQLKLQEE